MKKPKKKLLLAILALLIIVGGANSLYTIPRMQYAAVRQFGRIVAIKDTPGLNVKLPFIQSVQRISAATQIYDIPASNVITKDKKTMIADDYVLWRVTDPASYIRTLDATKPRAEERIEAAVYNAIKNVISSLSQDEVIAARGEKLTQLITDESNSDISTYGIEIVHSEIKSLDLPDDNKESVYERMISERQNIAATYKAEGEASAKLIRNDTDKQVTILKADAEKEAAIKVAEGEAQYMEILKDAYNTEAKAGFYNYMRSLDALKNSLSGDNKTIMLDKNSELARILYGNN